MVTVRGHDAQENREQRIINALSTLSPTDIINSEQLQTCFRAFFSRGTLEASVSFLPQSYQDLVCKTASTTTNSEIRLPNSIPSSLSNEQTSVLKYFQARTSNPERADRLVRLVRSLVNAKPLPPKSYDALWETKEEIFDCAGEELPRIQRLQQGRARIQESSSPHTCLARLCLLFFINDIDQTATKITDDLGRDRGHGRLTTAIEEVVRITSITKKRVLRERRKGGPYFRLLVKDGPGALLEIAPYSTSYWESKASIDDVDEVVTFKQSHLSELEKRTESLHPTCQTVVDEGLRAIGWTRDEIDSSKTPFLTQMRKWLEPDVKALPNTTQPKKKRRRRRNAAVQETVTGPAPSDMDPWMAEHLRDAGGLLSIAKDVKDSLDLNLELGLSATLQQSDTTTNPAMQENLDAANTLYGVDPTTFVYLCAANDLQSIDMILDSNATDPPINEWPRHTLIY